MAATFEGLVPVLAGAVAPQTILRVRAGLVSMSAAAAARPVTGAAVEREVADDLDALALSTAMWSVDGDGFDVLEDGLRSSYARGRDASADLADHPDAEELHELRKRVKDHWYHVRLLREVWPPVMTAWAGEARCLSEQLGDDHDLSVLAGVLSGEGPDLLGEDRPVVLGTIEERRGELLAGIRAGVGRIYADKPGAFTRRMARWWATPSTPSTPTPSTPRLPANRRCSRSAMRSQARQFRIGSGFCRSVGHRSRLGAPNNQGERVVPRISHPGPPVSWAAVATLDGAMSTGIDTPVLTVTY